MAYKDNLFEKMINLRCESAPRLIWEMDEKTFKKIQRVRDQNCEYAWSPQPNHPDMPGTLLGNLIVISEEPCFRLKYLFDTGTEFHSISFDMDTNDFKEKPTDESPNDALSVSP